MDDNRSKISDIFSNDFHDFVDFCHSMDKRYADELTSIDFVAYRTEYGLPKEIISQIKQRIACYSSMIEEVKDSTVYVPPISIQTIQKSSEPSVEGEGVADAKALDEKEVLLPTEEIDNNQGVPLGDNEDSPTPPKKEIADGFFQGVNSKQCFEALFQVDSNDYKDVSVSSLALSVRSENCLQKSQCYTLADILRLSPDELLSTKNLGRKSYLEIVEKVKNSLDEIPHSVSIGEASSFIITDSFQVVLDAYIAIKENISTLADLDLTPNEKECLSRLIDLEKELDPALLLQCAHNPGYAVQIIKSLNDFICTQQKETRILQLIPNEFLCGKYSDIYISPFLWAYSQSKNIKNFTINENWTFGDIRKNLPFFTNSKWKYFFDWLNFDVDEVCSSLLNSFSDELKDITLARAEGSTLDGVAQKYGVTRERIRQIELKALRKFHHNLQNARHDPFLLIYSLRNGDAYLTKDKFKERIFDERIADVIWYLISITKADEGCDLYYYSSKFNGIVFNTTGVTNIFTQVNSWAETLDEIVATEKLSEEINLFSNQSGISIDLVRKSLEGYFIEYKTLFSKHKLTNVEICDCLLKKFYPLGYKTSDDAEYLGFCKHIIEVFGDKIASMTMRAVDTKIGQVGVLCDRGKYIHPSYLDIPQDLINEVTSYISDSQRKAFAFSELFSQFKDSFYGTQITNCYALQGALGYYGCPFKMTKDYVLKEDDYSFTDEVEAFVEQHGTVHKSEIFEEFASLTETNLNLVTSRIRNVIYMGNGNYTHSSTLSILPEEYATLRSYLQQETSEMPVSIRKVVDDIGYLCPDMLNRNQVSDQLWIQNILNFMFWGEFNFSYPYIGKIGERNMTNGGMMLRLVENADRFNFGDLVVLFNNQMHTSFSPSYFVSCLSPLYIRIDDCDMMRTSLTGVTDAIIERTVELVQEQMNYEGYLPAARLTDFMWYPEINIPWTIQLVSSIISLSKKIRMLYFSPSYPCIFLSDKYEACNSYQDFLLTVLDGAFDNGFFASKPEMREWLIEQRLITDELPNFLESAAYYFYDENGILKRKQAEN